MSSTECYRQFRKDKPMSMKEDLTKQGFAKRFNAALDNIGIPPKYKGREKATAKLFGVSQKGARKWIEGEALPKTSRLVSMVKPEGPLKTTVEYLLRGAGETVVENEHFTQEQIATLRLMEGLTDDQYKDFKKSLEAQKRNNDALLKKLLDKQMTEKKWAQ